MPICKSLSEGNATFMTARVFVCSGPRDGDQVHISYCATIAYSITMMQNSFIHSVAHSKVAVKPYVYFSGFSLITANWEKNRGSKWEWFGNSLTHLVVSELWLIYKCIIFFLCQMWTSLGCIWRTSQKIYLNTLVKNTVKVLGIFGWNRPRVDEGRFSGLCRTLLLLYANKFSVFLSTLRLPLVRLKQ